MESVFKKYYIFGLIFIFYALVSLLSTQKLQAEWQHFTPANTNGGLSSSNITGLAMEQNKIWIATDNGLVGFDSTVKDLNDPTKGWTAHPEIDYMLMPISSIDIDKDGILWLGTSLGLVSYNPNDPNPETSVTIHGYSPGETDKLIEDLEVDQNYVWIAIVDSGLNRFDKSTGQWVTYGGDPNGFSPLSARVVASNFNDEIWVLPGLNGFSGGQYFGAYKFSLIDNKWEYFVKYDGMSEVVFNSVEISGNNDVWFSSYESGLWRYKSVNDSWTQWTQTTDGSSLSGIQCLGMDLKNNRIIISSDEGVYKYDNNFNFWRFIDIADSPDLGNHTVTDIVMDSSRNQIWFGTEDGGVYRLFEKSVIWTNPPNNSENIPIDIESIEFIFNIPMNPNTVYIDPEGRSLSISKSSDSEWADPNAFELLWVDPDVYTHLKLIPKAEFLDRNTWYTFTFTEGGEITDYSGSQIAKFTLRFKTGDPPRITDWKPLNLAYDVLPYAGIKIWFDRLMNTGSFFNPFTKIKIKPNTSTEYIDIYENDTNIQTIDNKTLLIINKPLSTGTQYNLTIVYDITDTFGNKMAGDFNLTFTTKPSPQLKYDEYSPLPRDGREDISVDTNISLKFNYSMNKDSVQSNFEIYPDAPGDIEWFNNNKWMIYTPLSPLDPNTWYTVTLSGDVYDNDGLPIEYPITLSFKTRDDPNALIPRIVSIYPKNQQGNISIYTNIVVVFSRPMNESSVENAFNLTRGLTEDVPGEFLWDSNSRIFIFTPDDLLDNDSAFTLRITTSAQSAGGRNLEPEKISGFQTLPGYQTVEPPSGEDWPNFPVDLNLQNLTFTDPNLVITAIATDKNSEIWMGLASRYPWTDLGLFHFDGLSWENYTTNNGLPSNSIKDLVFDSQGSLWVGTINGIAMHDTQGQWHTYDPNDLDNKDQMSEQDIKDFFAVNSIDVYSDGISDTIWIASTGGLGVGIYDQESGDWKWSGRVIPYIYTLFVDDSNGYVWFESGNPFWSEDNPCEAVAGIDAKVIKDNILQWPDIWDIQNLWVWNPNFIFQRVRYQMQQGSSIRSIASDVYGGLWLATDRGLFQIEIDRLIAGECEFHMLDPFNTTGGLLSDSIFEVEINPDDPNQLYIATDKGISVFTLNTSTSDPANWTKLPFISTGADLILIDLIPKGGVLASPGSNFLIIGDNTAPTIISLESFPHAGDDDVPINQELKIVFSELMDTVKTENAFSLKEKDSGNSISVEILWEGRSMKFQPALDQGTEYVLAIETTAKDLVGNSLLSAYNITFKTTQSLVSRTIPRNGTKNVKPAGLIIEIEFIEPMNKEETQNALCLRNALDTGTDPNGCVDGDFEWSEDARTLWFSPEELSVFTTYNLTVDETAKTAQGVNMPSVFAMSFVTGTAESLDVVLKFEGDGCFIKSIAAKRTDIWGRIRNLFRKDL